MFDYFQVVECAKTYRINDREVKKFERLTEANRPAGSDDCSHPCQTAAVLSKHMVYPSNCLDSAGYSTHCFHWKKEKEKKKQHTSSLEEQNKTG